MQEILNSNWYAHNEMISYPLEGTCVDDSGNALPSTLITDLRIVSSVNQNFYIGGVTCSEYIISVIVCSSRGLETMITIQQPVTPETHYTMESIHSDEVSGVIAFGRTDNYGQWRFSTTAQSQLCPSCQIRLQKWPVFSLGIGTPLRGDVGIIGGASVTVQPETVYVGNNRAAGLTCNNATEAVVLRLQASDNENTSGSEFLGNCAIRPDNSDGTSSSECPYITSLGGATPDYNGNIQITIDADETVSDIYSSYSITTAGSTVTTDCGTERECSNIKVSITEKEKEREAMIFGQCGINECDPPEDTGSPVNTSNVYPLTGNGIAYSDNGLTSLDGESIIGTDESGFHIHGVFNRNGLTGYCGISWGETEHSFKYDGTVLSMDSQRIAVSTSAQSIVLTLVLENGTVTGTLLVNDTILGTLSCSDTSLGTTGVILNNWSCTDWRIS